jgi:hypothetical protein
MRLSDTGRSAHPSIRANTLRHYPLDEAGLGSALDHARGATAAVVGASAGPFSVESPTGTGRRFSDTVAAGLTEGSTDAELQAAALGDWTASVLIRLTASPSGTDYAWTISGDGSSELAANNYLASLRILTDRRMGVLWEHSAGTDVASETTTYKLPLYKWTLVTVVKSATTGPGPGGTCTVTWYVNGYEVETTPGVVNASDGSSAVLRLGNNLATVPDRFPQADIDCFQFHQGVLDVDSIREDVRRLYLLPFHARTDAKVLTEDSTGVMRDLTNHNGLDWVDSVETVDEIDQACSTATIRLLREQGSRSLAGFRTDTINNLTDAQDVSSFAQLITEGRDVEVFTARLPLGLVATARDWVSAFKGAIDDIEEASGEAVVLNCRDQGGRLVDTYIEETITYGAPDPGSAVEGEMQFILDDNDNVLGPTSTVARTGSYAPLTLYTPTSPSWAVLEWKQRREGVLAALRTLAGQIGWECRYRWDPNPSAPQWRLTFYDPDRDRLDADVLFKADDILEVTQFARSILGIRNVVRVVYPSSETAAPAVPALPAGYTGRSGWNDLDGEGARMTAYVEVQSDDSITLYGQRLFMEIAESSSSQIDSMAEAFRMAYGALRDLEVAQLDKGITLPCMPEMELNDFVLFAPNAQLFSGTQRLAVKRLTHTIGDTCTTQVQLRGKPSVGWKRWLRLETRAGNGRPGVVSPDDANADLAQGDLLKVVRNILDRTSYLKGGKFLQVRNGSFQGFANGKQHPPDAWAMRAGTWITDAEADTTDNNSGNIAVRLKTVTAQLETDLIPCQADHNTPYSVQLTWKRGAVSTYYPRVDVEFYDVNKVLLAGTLTLEPAGFRPCFETVPNTSGVWFTSRADGVRPPSAGTARFIRLVVRGSLTGVFTPLWIDDVALYRTARELKSYYDTNVMGSLTPVDQWFPVRWVTQPYPLTVLEHSVTHSNDWGNNHFQSGTGATALGLATVPLTGETVLDNSGASVSNAGWGFYAREDGLYHIQATVIAVSPSNAVGQYMPVRIVKNATYNAVANQWYNTGGLVLFQGNAQQLEPKGVFGNAALNASAFLRATIMNMQTTVNLKKGERITVEWYRHNFGGISIPIPFPSLLSDATKIQIKHEQVQ